MTGEFVVAFAAVGSISAFGALALAEWCSTKPAMGRLAIQAAGHPHWRQTDPAASAPTTIQSGVCNMYKMLLCSLAALVVVPFEARADTPYYTIGNGGYSASPQLDQTTGGPYKFGSVTTPPTHLAADANGIYSATTSNISHYGLNGQLIKSVDFSSDFTITEIAAYGNNFYYTIGNGLYITDANIGGSDGPYKVSSVTAPLIGLAVDANGIYSASANNISHYSLTGQLIKSMDFSSDFTITEIAAYGDNFYYTIGNGLYIADANFGGDNGPYKVSSVNVPLIGLAVDSDGIYSASKNNISRYSFTGQLLDSDNFSSDFSIGTLAVNASIPAPPPAAVPEPQAWALLILGFGFVGGSLRRRGATDRTSQWQAGADAAPRAHLGSGPVKVPAGCCQTNVAAAAASG